MLGCLLFTNSQRMIVLEKIKIGYLKIAITSLALACFSPLAAQVPYVSSIDKTSARPQSTVTIKGLNFGTSTSAIKVWFGGVSATPTTISDQLIEVKVPFGATFESVRVENTTTGLSGGSSVPFLPSFGGTNPFVETKLGSQLDFDSESDLYEHAMADFDGDGKLDMATANKNSNFISIFRNTSTPGAISFVKTQLNPAIKTIHVAAGDLNGDAKPDLIVTESNGSKVLVFKNTSTLGSIAFSALAPITLSGSKPNQIRIEDLDLDGKPDVVLTDQATGTARIYVLKNQSTTATISLAGPQSITLASSTGTDGIAIVDMNGDHLPDIAMGEFLTANSRIFILRNTSAPGAISFFQSTPINISTTVSNFAIGDLDGDQKPDVAISLLLSASVMILKNQTTGTELAFADPVLFDAGTRPWGIDIGDADGDGKMDLAVASITTKTVSVLNNTSTAGNLSFVLKSISTTFINRIIKFADVDNDSRPDLVFTSIDDTNLGIPASKVSIMRNLNCVVPVISPTGPLTVCNTFTQRLLAPESPGASYEWFKDGVSMGAPSGVSFKDVTATGSGSYTVRLTDTGCSQTSNAVQINVVTSAPSGPTTINPVAPVCQNGTLTLTASTATATQYKWTGPAGFSATGVSVNRTSFQAAHAGKYNLDVIVGTCLAEQVSLIVDIVDVPSLTVQMEGTDIICTGDSKTLTFLPEVTGFSYQWAEQTLGDLAGQTNASVSVTTSGQYLVKLKSTLNGSCPVISSPAKKLRVANKPTVDFTFPSKICKDVEAQFTNASTTDIDASDPTITYTWNFGDGKTSSQENPKTSYGFVQNYNVSLTVGYRENACPATLLKTVSVEGAPIVQITNPDDRYNVCLGYDLKLEVLGSFNSYAWSTGESTSSILVTAPGAYTVDVDAGCLIHATKTIGSFSSPLVNATATPKDINVGDVVVLKATGAVDYSWTPTDGIEFPDQATTNATPPAGITYTVRGTDANGCYNDATVTISLIGEGSIGLLKPENYFSPNGDAFNPFWEVENAPFLSQCGVTIFDELGIKVFDAKPYENNWDGTSSKGTKLPAGVYFYIIRCDDSKSIKKGSINLIR